MTKLDLPYVQSFGGYHYFRRAGYPRIRLPGVVGSTEFMEAYQAALNATTLPIGRERSKPGSVSAGIAAYYGSHAFKRLTGGTPAKRRAILERFRADHGHLPLRGMPPKFIRALLDTMAPHSARNWLKAIRAFTRWCLEHELIREDPTLGVRIQTARSDGHHSWTDAEILQFETFHPIGSKARLALAIGLCTALRRGDAIRIGRQHIRGDELIIPRTEKTKIALVLPVLPELRQAIDATPTGHLTLLTTKTGKSYNPNDFSEQFRKWCDDAGLPPECSFHGLRKAALTRLADQGKTVHQIAAVSGHKTLKLVQHYTAAADQRKLAREALLGEQNGAITVKPDGSGLSNPLKVMGKK